MAYELAGKLRVTLALLGCNSRKELCARFREVNPNTEFYLERSKKWLQGRAKPRTGQVYEDWGRLLRTEQTGTWLAACTVDAFLDEVCARFAADREDLRRRAGLADADHPTDGRDDDAVHYLCGLYVGYSLAWSPYYQGQLIRSSLLIRPGRGSRFPVVYREGPPAPLQMQGTLVNVGRALHAEVREASSGAPLYFSAFLPGRPANALSGVMPGASFMGPEPESWATRIAFVRTRVTVAPELERALCYLDADAGALEADPAASGVAVAEGCDAGAELARFLAGRARPGTTQVGQADQARLAQVFDNLPVRPPLQPGASRAADGRAELLPSSQPAFPFTTHTME